MNNRIECGSAGGAMKTQYGNRPYKQLAEYYDRIFGPDIAAIQEAASPEDHGIDSIAGAVCLRPGMRFRFDSGEPCEERDSDICCGQLPGDVSRRP